MEQPTLPPIRLKKTARSFASERMVARLIVEEVKKIPGYVELKNDMELLAYIVSTATASIRKSKSRPVDPKAVALSIMKELFSLNSVEESDVAARISYIQQNGLVQSASCVAAFASFLARIVPPLLKKSST
jgi:hypothetical protein